MIVSTIVSTIAFATIVIVTIVLANQTKSAKEDVENRLRNVVDQVNTAQQYSYEFDKRQTQQVTGLERNVDDLRNAYATKKDMANKVSTKLLEAETIRTGPVQLSDSIQFNGIDGASKNPDYLISRGKTTDTQNHLVINAPTENGAGINLTSSGGSSRLFVDGSTGQVTIPNNLKAGTVQVGDKFKLQGNDEWLRLYDQEGKNYYGGLDMANLSTQNSASLNGVTNIKGRGVVDGTLMVSGAQSEYNVGNLYTSFGDSMNFIAGDTHLIGNSINWGDSIVGKDLGVVGSLNTSGPANITGPVKVNHNNTGGWIDQAPLSVYTPAGTTGASFGTDMWSQLPGADGNTYIRPGSDKRDIFIGDIGASSVNIGKGDTNVNIKGNLTVNNPKWNWLKMDRTGGDEIYFGADDVNKGISSVGNRDLGFYTNGVNRLNIGTDGKTTVNGPIQAPSIGVDSKNNGWFNVNNQNPNSQGTAVYNGLSVKDGGGLSVGDWKKMPEGQGYFRDALKVGHSMTGNWTDKATISSWVPDNTKIGGSFGGPDNWSHLPFSDGNTYIRSGKTGGDVKIGDTGTGTVQLGGDLTTQVQVGQSYLPNANGHSYIRPGKQNQNIYIGDTMTGEVNLGGADGTGSVITRPYIHWARRHVDAWDNWDNSGRTISTGWNSEKTVLGNNASGGQNYVLGLPKDTVASANDLYVNGKATATNQLCVNNTCLSEGDINKLKSWL